jgi:hypothetical protein
MIIEIVDIIGAERASGSESGTLSVASTKKKKKEKKKKKKNSRSKGGPGVNEVSFHARPHRSVHSTLGVDTRANGPRWRVDSIEGDRIGKGGNRVER